jgi:hypothetical protein
MPGSQPLASNGGPAADLPGSWSPGSLNDQLREPPRTLRRAPQKSHKSAIRTAPTDIPRTRRHSAAHPGTHAKIENKTAFDQAKCRFCRLSAVPIGGGQGQDRTVDLPLFRDRYSPRSPPPLMHDVLSACDISARTGTAQHWSRPRATPRRERARTLGGRRRRDRPARCRGPRSGAAGR